MQEDLWFEDRQILLCPKQGFFPFVSNSPLLFIGQLALALLSVSSFSVPSSLLLSLVHTCDRS